MQRLRTFFRTRMIARLWLSIVGPIVLVTLCIVVATGVLFNSFLLNSAVSAAETETVSVAEQFSRNYRDLLVRLVRKTASAAFRAQAVAVAQCTQSRYTEVNNALQETLDEYRQMSGMIQTSLIVATGRGEKERLVFFSYNYSLRDRQQLLDYDLSGVNGMTVLPAVQSPVANLAEVIPLVIPLRFTNDLLLICEDPAQSDLILYLFLDAAAVNEYLNVYCDDASEGSLYLANAGGLPLSLSAAQLENSHSRAADPALQQRIAHAIGSGRGYFVDGGDYVYVSAVQYCGMYLVNIVPHEQFLTGRDTIYSVLLLLALTSVVVVTVVCSLISVFTTEPLRSLMSTVHEIEDGSYDGALHFDREDEIGQLEKALNTMNRTIHRQMEDIQQKEQEKFNAKMQLLTEQINPHFLYNTLEFINMEVLTGHPENASHMIAALGDYTRISLAYGDNEHTIQQELKQAAAYVDIMSCRFSHPVDLRINVPEKLRAKLILKCTLQPLVENSLKHGFGMSAGGVPFSPRIDISIAVQGPHLVIAVVDNGAGIDIPRARKILLEGSGDGRDRHIGLHNIYERLTAYYGKAEFEFSSLPYFENKVEIRLPAGLLV